MVRIFREGLLFSCQRLLINTGSSPVPRAEPANSWHLWMWGRKVLGFEGKGLGEAGKARVTGKGRNSIPNRDGTQGEATQGSVVARKVWLVQSEYK